MSRTNTITRTGTARTRERDSPRAWPFSELSPSAEASPRGVQTGGASRLAPPFQAGTLSNTSITRREPRTSRITSIGQVPDAVDVTGDDAQGFVVIDGAGEEPVAPSPATQPGSPPCQSLSVANKMTGSTKKGLRLVRWFLDVVESLDPSSWSMEQVPNKKLLHLLTTRGVPFHVVNAADHSVPQSRKRVIAGSKIVVEAMKKAAGTGPTVLPKDVLTNLQPSRHSLQNGTENESVHRDGKYVGLRAKRADEGLRSLNEPAHTVWSKPGRVVEKNRVVRLLTPAEMARLQGFPANFKLDEKSLTRSRLVVGNALPPPLAFNIMRAAMKTL